MTVEIVMSIVFAVLVVIVCGIWALSKAKHEKRKEKAVDKVLSEIVEKQPFRWSDREHR